MNLNEFFDKYSGRYIDYDGKYGAQCVDLFRQYVKEVLQIPQCPGVSGAADLWDVCSSDKFEKVPNTPSGVPELGDIVIWNRRLGNGYGHVGIFNSGDTNSFFSFDQNWPVGAPCHLVEHSYSSVTGWLHPKENMPDTVQVPSSTFESLVNKSTKWDEVQKLGYTSAAQIEADVRSLKGEIKKQRDEAQSQRDRADANRSEYTALLAKVAKTLQTVQEPVEVYNALDKLEANLDLLDDLKRQFAELQLHSKEQVEELTAEINRLKLLKTSLDDATFEELLGAIIRRLLNIIRKV